MVFKHVVILTNGVSCYEIESITERISFSLTNLQFHIRYYACDFPDHLLIDENVYFEKYEDLEKYFSMKCKEIINKGFW